MYHSTATAGKKSTPRWQRILISSLTMLFVAFVISGLTQAKAVYVIHDGNNHTTVVSRRYNASAVVKEAGIDVANVDELSTNNGADGSTEINILRGQRVYVNYENATLSVYAHQESVAELLAGLGIELDELDVVSVDLSHAVTDEMIISVNNIEVEYVTVEESVPFETVRTADATMTAGKETVTQEGKNGTAKVTYAVTFENSEETSRTATETEVVSAPVTKKVTYGTKAASITSSDSLVSDNGSVLTFKSGSTLSYSKKLSCTATAYTASSTARTATGTVVCVGTVAVDPSVIPLGSKLYIQTSGGGIVYGTAVARDTGGSIKGNKVDLFYSSYNQCVQFGRRTVAVYVLN